MNEGALHELQGGWREDERFLLGLWLRSQNFTIPVTVYETAPSSRQGTRMTRIGRISTDYPRASASSAQSVFYCLPSAFIRVHPRLIFNRKTQEALAG